MPDIAQKTSRKAARTGSFEGLDPVAAPPRNAKLPSYLTGTGINIAAICQDGRAVDEFLYNSIFRGFHNYVFKIYRSNGFTGNLLDPRNSWRGCGAILY
jgi:hypothetical protein